MHKIAVFLLIILLISCVSNTGQGTVSPGAAKPFTVTIVNNTPVDFELIDDTRLIPRNSEKNIAIADPSDDLNDGYKIFYRIYLLDDLFIRIPRKENLVISPYQDRSVPVASVDIDFQESFLVLRNESKYTITLNLDTNSTNYVLPVSELQPGRKYHSSPYMESDGKRLYERLGTWGNRFCIETDLYAKISFALESIKPSYVYTYTFTGSAVSLADARPLHRMGEAFRPQAVNEATGCLALSAGGGQMHLFAPTKNGLSRYDFDSAGNAVNQVPCGDSFVPIFAARAGDGFFAAGYAKGPSQYRQPVARLLGADGKGRELAPSPKYGYGYFQTAAQNDSGEWLLAGAAGEQRASRGAYVRLVSGKEGVPLARWELGKNDFAVKTNSLNSLNCGEITSAVYDSVRERWFVTGENVGAKGLVGSYVAVIDNSGKIEKIDTPFRGMVFYKTLSGANGDYYLAGEEQQGNETHAVLIAYNVDSGNWQRLSGTHTEHSYYQTALLDSENKQIVLGGVLGARDGGGQGGKPFVEAVGIEQGTLPWQEELSVPAFAGLALVTGIAPAPDYGFAVALSGIGSNEDNETDFSKPFVIARVNSQGKLPEGKTR